MMLLMNDVLLTSYYFIISFIHYYQNVFLSYSRCLLLLLNNYIFIYKITPFMRVKLIFQTKEIFL